MATIANLVIQIGANASGVKVELDRANGYLRQFANTTQQTMGVVNKGLRSGAIKSGHDAAEVLSFSLQQKFQQTMGNAREQMFRGLIDPASFKRNAREAAASYNAGLLTGIEELRAKNILPADVLLGLQTQLKDAGLKSGKEFAVSFTDSLKQHGDLLVKAGEGMIKSITLPIVGAGGMAAKLAGEAEIAAGRMKIVWGPMTDDIEQQLDVLHKRIPATTTELKNMTAITSELLLPLGIMPGKVKEMSLNFIELSKDLSILNNVSPERTMHALQSSLVGMTRPLKLLGVDITDMGIKLKAQEMGLVKEGETLNETGKAIAAYALVMERASLVQSAAAKLQGTFLVQLRFLKRDATEAGIAFGQVLLPALLPLVQGLIRLINWLSQMNPTTMKWIVTLALMAAAIGPTVLLIGKLTLAFRILLLAIELVRVKGFLALATLLVANPIAAAITAIVVAVGLMVLAFKNANKELRDFQNQASQLDKSQVMWQTAQNADRMRRLESERNALLAQQQTRTVTRYNPGLGTSIQTTELTDAGKRVAELNEKLREGGQVMLALGQRFQQIATQERVAEEDLQHWLDKMAEFEKRGETAFTKPKKSIDILRDAVSVLIDRLELFRNLNLDISAPLAAVQRSYDAMVKSAGGLANIHKLDADRLRIVLQLQNAIADAIRERDERPRVDAGLAMENLRVVREEAIDLVQIDTNLVTKAFADARKKLEALDKAIAPGGALESDRQAKRLSAQMHRMLGNMGDFVEYINDQLIEITGVGQDLPWSAVRRGLYELHNELMQVGASNASRFARLKSSFGMSVTTPEGDVTPGVDLGGAALDMLKGAALGLAESFGPLAILAKLISAALEPIQPAIEAFLLPLMMVAKVIGSALIPVLRALFPVLKFFAIAATYVGEIFYKISALIMRAIGSLVRGLGRLINKLPGSPGDPLVKAGQAMLDLADGYTEAARDMARTREELKDMTFDNAMDKVNGLADAANRASQNIPQLFKVAAAVFASARPSTSTPRTGNVPTVTPPTVNPPSTPGTGGGGGGGGGQTPTVIQVQSVTVGVNAGMRNARQLTDEIFTEVRRQALAESGTTALNVPGVL